MDKWAVIIEDAKGTEIAREHYDTWEQASERIHQLRCGFARSGGVSLGWKAYMPHVEINVYEPVK
jgi:hypothetical protein